MPDRGLQGRGKQEDGMKVAESRKRSARSALWYGAAACAFMIAPARAQTVEKAEPRSSSGVSEGQAQDEIVVTGTLIRGVAPIGTNVIGITTADIARTGASNANQILAQVPQVTNAFNATPSLGAGGGAALSIVRPNLRGLPETGGTTTLVLIDGHRAAGAGILQTSAEQPQFDPERYQFVRSSPAIQQSRRWLHQ